MKVFAALLLLGAGLVHGQEMAITFDDLPVHGDLPSGVSRLQVIESIAGTLKQSHLPPVYGFINGAHLDADPALLGALQAWRAAGQPLGNHTWSHQDLSEQTAAQFATEAGANEPLLRQLMGHEDWHWFRYPYLHEGDTLAKHRSARSWLAQHHYRVAEVTEDFNDYLYNGPYARCLDRHDAAALRQLHDAYLLRAAQSHDFFRELSRRLYGREPRLVLLMHVGAFDAKMLPELLDQYRAQGVKFISLEEAIADPVYRDDPVVAAPDGGSLQELMLQKKRLSFPPDPRPQPQLDALCR